MTHGAMGCRNRRYGVRALRSNSTVSGPSCCKSLLEASRPTVWVYPMARNASKKRSVVVLFPLQGHNAILRIRHVDMAQVIFDLCKHRRIFLLGLEVIEINHQLDVGIVYGVHPL